GDVLGMGRPQPPPPPPPTPAVEDRDGAPGGCREGPAVHGKAPRVDELRLDVEQRGPAGGIERDLAERAADRGLERKLMLELDLCRRDRHEAEEVYADRRAGNGGEGAPLRDAYVSPSDLSSP